MSIQRLLVLPTTCSEQQAIARRVLIAVLILIVLAVLLALCVLVASIPVSG